MKGVFIATGEDAVRISSPDGREWSDPVDSDKVKAENNKKGSWAGGGSFWGMAVGGGRAVAVGPYGSGGGIRSSTANGVDWTEIELIEKNGRLLDVTWGNGRFVGVGGEVPNYIHCYWSYTDDGVKWAPMKHLARKQNRDVGGLIRVAYGNDRFVAAGRTGKFAISEDHGESWRFFDAEDSSPVDATFLEITFGAGLFVGVGLHGLRRTSPDGETWSEPLRGEEGEHISAIRWTGEQFVGVAPGATWFSPDGKDWERKPNESAPITFAYGNGFYAGARYRGELLFSEDAVHWEPVKKIDQDIRAMVFLPL